MIPRECKRLAEVDFPIAAVSKHAAREKSIRHGHPSTLHIWWARRPLAACRAVLLALLLPDPADPLCPEAFKAKARKLLEPMPGSVGDSDHDLRQAILRFVADFANWDNAARPAFLDVGRGLVQATHPEETPLVVDPFAGGGSIPLEALRLGCEAFASELNPVACLILKVMLEDIPRHGPGLADELRRVGAEIRAAAEKELAEFYPPDPDGARPIAYLWARTVRCEAPGCGAEIPLMRSFWLSKKASRRRALRYRIEHPNNEPPRVAFEVFTPKADRDVPRGTVTRAKATCLACGTALAPERVRAQLAAQRGGADAQFGENGERVGGARLLAVVTLRSDRRGREYRLPTEEDYEAIRKAQKAVAELVANAPSNAPSPVPDEPLPPVGTLGFRVQRYGMTRWGDLFTARQKLALVMLCRGIYGRGPSDVSEILGLIFNGSIDRNAVLARWRPQADQEKVENVFGRQALPMSWDFGEAVPISESTGSWNDRVAATSVTVDAFSSWGRSVANAGQVQAADAMEYPLPDQTAQVWFTDPPYYDAVPYADLSDFFFVWLRRALPEHPLFRDPSDPGNDLTPKVGEIVQDETKRIDNRAKDRAFFEEAMGTAFTEGCRVLRADGVGSVVFAHKTTEGWEALLSGMTRGGWTITASWPIATEMASRLRARESAALATSVHLVCRPRTENKTGDWAEVLRELPDRVADWMEHLQREGVRGADLVFACIGPALEIYSRYARVVDAADREIPLGGDPTASEPHKRGYLAYVWETIARAALEQVLGTPEAQVRNGGAAALEEDARLTALFLWTLQTATGGPGANADQVEPEGEAEDEEAEEEDETVRKAAAKGFTLVYDIVRRFAQPLGIHLDAWDKRIIETSKGVVRLLPVRERAKQLFGEAGAQGMAHRIERAPQAVAQLQLFPEEESGPAVRGRGSRRGPTLGEGATVAAEATTLDRVHAAMLLQASGQATALRALLKAEQDRGPDFQRLANALSALYPRESEEKRLLDAMLLAMPK